MKPGVHFVWMAAVVLALSLPVATVRAGAGPVAVFHNDTEQARSVARRLSAELRANGFTARDWPCPAGPATPCAVPAAGSGARVVIEALPGEPVHARVEASGRSAGPFQLDSDAADRVDAVGRFALELATWVDVLDNPSAISRLATLSPAAGVTATSGASDSGGRAPEGRRLHLGLGGLYAYDQTGFEGSGGGELSVAWDWAIGKQDQRLGLRLAAGASPLSRPISLDGIRVTRSPVTAAALATTARSPGRWTLEAHGGLGIELQRLTAVDIRLPGSPTVSRGRRVGPIAQAGLAVLCGLGDDQRDGRFSVGVELRMVYAMPSQVVVVGDRRFGGRASPPALGLAIIGRWTTR
jgi:hypothetical protein